MAGVTLNLTLGENGLLRMAEHAEKAYENAKNKESSDLENLYSSMMVATGDDAKITISMEDLNKLIEDKINEKVR